VRNITRLYRGSCKKTEIVNPSPVDVDDIEKLRQVGISNTLLVWATPFKKNALAFAALSGKVSFALNTVGSPTNSAESITFYQDDWERKLDQLRIVYCYTFTVTGLNTVTFRKVNDREYVCANPIVPILIEEYTVKQALDLFQIEVKPMDR